MNSATAVQGSRQDRLNDEIESYGLLHVCEHFYETNRFSELFHLIEATDYLIEQAEYFAGFEQCSRTIESHALPAAIKKKDWRRFIRYAVMGANLRGIAEALNDAAALQALVRSGYEDFALDIARQIPGSANRASAKAVIAAALRDEGRNFRPLLIQIREDLDSCPLPGEASEAKQWSQALQSVSSRLASEWADRWCGWLDRIESWPGHFREAASAIADGLLCSSPLDDPLLWEILSVVGDFEALAQFLPSRLAKRGIRISDPFLDRVESSLPGGRFLAWRIRVAVLSRHPEMLAEIEPDLWRELGVRVAWKADLVEQGRGLWRALAPQRLEEWLLLAGDKTTAAAIRVIRLEERKDADSALAARQAVAALDPGSDRLHWSLRLLEAWPNESLWRAQGVAAAAECLLQLRYSVCDRDLCGFLNLIGEIHADQLEVQLQNVLWAPKSSPATLRCLTRHGNKNLLEQILISAEACAAGVSRTEAYAFELRREVIVTAASRLCAWDQKLDALDQATKILMPQEVDELRLAVAQLWKGSASQLIPQVQPGPLRLSARMELMDRQAEQGQVLRPETVYESIATADSALDERHSLSILHEAPLEPLELARQYSTRISQPARQIEALADLALHSLCFEETHFGDMRQDREAAVLPLRNAQAAPRSEEGLASTFLLLAQLGAQADRSMALTECQEAALRIAELESVGWQRREEVLSLLLSRLDSLLIGDCPTRQRRFRFRCRQAAAFADWVVDLPAKAESESARHDLMQHWHRLFPWITVALERLPWQVRGKLQHPVRWSLCATTGLVRLFGWRRAWGLIGRIERLIVPVWLRQRLQGRWRERILGRFARRWKGMGGSLQLEADVRIKQDSVLQLCLCPPLDRMKKAKSLSACSENEIRHALSILLSQQAPEQVPDLVRRLPDPAKDRLILQLIQGGWLPGGQCEILLGLVADRSLASLAETWLGLTVTESRSEKAWLAALTDSISSAALDTDDAANAPIRHLIWRLNPQNAWPVLARSTVFALGLNGKEASEKALRLFLNAYLAPSLGKKADDDIDRRNQEVDKASWQALRLVCQDGEQEPQNASPERLKENQSRHLERIRRRWQKANKFRPHGESESRPLGKPLRFGLLAGFMLAMILIPFDLIFFPIEIAADSPTEGRLGAVPGWLALSLLAALYLANGWVIDRFLSWRTADEYRFKAWVRSLRFVLAGIPVVGYWAIPGWRWFERKQPSWALLERPYPGPDLSPNGDRKPSWFYRAWRQLRVLGCHWFESTVILAGWLLLNFGVPFLSLPVFLPRSLPKDLAAASALVAASLAMHLFAFASVATAFWLEIRQAHVTGARAWIVLSLSILWLPPVPGLPLLGILLYLISDLMIPSDLTKKSLVRQASLATRKVANLPLWLRLEESLSSRRANRPVEAMDREDKMVSWFYRIKASALLVEGAFLAGLVHESQSATAQAILHWSRVPLLALGIAGLLAMACRFFRPFSMEPGQIALSSRLSIAHYLAGSQLSLVAGIEMGSGLASGNALVAGGTLQLAGALGGIVCILPLMAGIFVSRPEKTDRQTRERIGWIFLFVGLMAMGQSIVQGGSDSESFLRFLEALTTFGPQFSILFGAVLLNWLFRPYYPRQLFTGKVNASVRRPLVFMLCAALLPMGGLVIPCCIRLRSRRWPALRRQWAER